MPSSGGWCGRLSWCWTTRRYIFVEFRNKIAFLLGRREVDGGLAEEMAFHIAERTDELVREGVAPAEARRRAQLEFGSVARVAEDTRSAWQFGWVEEFFSDLRYAARGLRREPGFLATAVLSLALGIGVNTAIFSLTVEFLLSNPSVRDGSTLAYVRLGGSSHMGLEQYQFVRDAKAFPGAAGYRAESEINWRNGEETRRLFAMRVTGNLFGMAGIPVLAGRGIAEGDEAVAVVSYRMSQGKLGGDPGVVGRTLILDGRPHLVIGVLPEDHRTLTGMGLQPDLYTTIKRGQGDVQLYLRLPEGMAPATVMRRLEMVAAELDKAMPERMFKYAEDIKLTPVNGVARVATEKSLSLFFFMLMAVVTLLLGIACLNVSGLLLARASARGQEFAIRASLGAGKGRLLRQMLTESMLLAVLGTVAGLGLNLILTQVLSSVPLDLPVPIQIRIDPDWRLLGYASGVGLLTALMVGMLPAMRAAGAGVLKEAEHQVSGRLTLRRVLVVAQVATSMIVLTTAVLFGRNLMESVGMRSGFDLDKRMYVSVRLVPENYPDAAALGAFAERARGVLAAVPGVESVAATRMIPFNDDTTNGGTVRTDVSDAEVRIKHHSNRVGPGYFRTLGVGLVAGREFVDRDEDVVILNESFARMAFGDVSAVGHRVRFGGRERMVVGVVRDSKYAWMGDYQRPAAFEPFRADRSRLQFMVRAGVDPETLVRPLLRTAGGLDAGASVEVKPMKRAMGMAYLPSQVGAGLLGLMGVLGLLLTGIGLYGLMAYSVARRVREIGLRVALGAAPGRVLALVFGEGAWLVGLGLGIGLFAAFFVTKPLATYLVEGVRTTDPLTYLAVSGLMVFCGWLACAVPARRALRIEPMEALRWE